MYINITFHFWSVRLFHILRYFLNNPILCFENCFKKELVINNAYKLVVQKFYIKMKNFKKYKNQQLPFISLHFLLFKSRGAFEVTIIKKFSLLPFLNVKKTRFCFVISKIWYFYVHVTVCKYNVLKIIICKIQLLLAFIGFRGIFSHSNFYLKIC